MVPPRGAPELSLVFSDGRGHPVVYTIPKGTTTIGSASDNDVVLDDASVKPHQVVLIRDGDRLELRDLFAGETRINDEVRRSGPIRAGDVIRLGLVRLRVMKVSPGRMAPGRRTTRRLRARVTQSLRAAKAAKNNASAAPAAVDPALEEELRQVKERDARRSRALARARQLTDELMPQDDFEIILEQIAVAFLTIFSADRAVTVLFEEDGRNPLLTVERRQDGTDEGTGVAQEIIDRCLQVRSVIRVSGGYSDLGGLAAPLLTEGRALGLLYFERNTRSGRALGPDDVHLMAVLTAMASLKIAPLLD